MSNLTEYRTVTEVEKVVKTRFLFWKAEVYRITIKVERREHIDNVPGPWLYRGEVSKDVRNIEEVELEIFFLEYEARELVQSCKDTDTTMWRLAGQFEDKQVWDV